MPSPVEPGSRAPQRQGLAAPLARLAARRPWTVVLVAAVLTAAAALAAATGLRVETDRMSLIGEQHRYNRNFGRLIDEFGDVDAMVVVLAAPDRGTARACADDLAARIAAEADLLPSVFYRVPEEALAGRALLFVDLPRLEAIEAALRQGAPAVGALLERGLGAFFSGAAEGMRAALAASAAGGPAGGTPDPFAPVRPFVLGVEQAVRGERPASAPWQAWIPPGALQGRDGYTWTQDGRLVLLVQPQRGSTEVEVESVHALRRLIAQLPARFPEVTVGLTGEPVLEADELATYRRDAWRATLASLLGVTVLFMVALRRLLGPLLACATLAAALVGTLGVATIWPGRLNLISVALGALLVGLGIDYAIHLISRYDEERARGLPREDALRMALSRTGGAVVAGGLTTALAFLATLFTEVQGIREFGVVAGVGVLLSLVANLVLLPALVVLADRGPGGRPRRPRVTWPRTRVPTALDRLVERHPAWLVIGGLALAVGALVYALAPAGADGRPRLRYEANLLRLQAQELPSVRLASEVLTDPGLSGMFAAITVDDLASLRRVEDVVRRLPTVAETQSILDVTPDRQPEKLAVLARLRAHLEGLPPVPVAPRAPAPAEVLAQLARGAETLVRALEEVGRAALAAERPQAAQAALRLQERVDALARLASEGGERVASAVARHEVEVRRDLSAALARLASECGDRPLTPDDLPREVRERFVGRTGKLLLRVYPAESPWDAQALARFVESLEAHVPDVGGVPVQFHESDRLIRAGYLRAGQIALVFVVFYLVVHFRGLALPAVALLTLLVGASWAIGVMALLDLDVNPANLLALPLTLGIGIDYAVHLVHRDREARRLGPSLAGAPSVLATSTGRSVFLSALTTVVGFGVLATSAHRGVASIGWTICLGVGACLASAVLFGPALLRLGAGRSWPIVLRGIAGPKTGPGGSTIRPNPPSPPDE